jgi:hypothetical protein
MLIKLDNTKTYRVQNEILLFRDNYQFIVIFSEKASINMYEHV